MRKRIVYISCDPEPIGLNPNNVWIKVDDKANAADSILAGIRMRPDELRIEKELFGFFKITK